MSSTASTGRTGLLLSVLLTDRNPSFPPWPPSSLLEAARQRECPYWHGPNNPLAAVGTDAPAMREAFLCPLGVIMSNALPAVRTGRLFWHLLSHLHRHLRPFLSPCQELSDLTARLFRPILSGNAEDGSRVDQSSETSSALDPSTSGYSTRRVAQDHRSMGARPHGASSQ
jgi:hypothetical protein